MVFLKRMLWRSVGFIKGSIVFHFTTLPLGWDQIDEHSWYNMTSQLIIQCCRVDQTVQLAVFNSV